MPDAVVMNQEIEGMAVVAIMGWQAYDLSSGTWGESEYRKKYSLFFRTEMNPSIGVTKSGWWRVEGLRVYEAKQAQDKDDKEPKLYYINESGKMKSIDSDDVTRHAKHREELRLHIPGYADGVFKRPDRELMAMVDGMLGETSCMGNPSKCAFRCFYDSEHDVCGPVAFCQKAGTGAPDILAPFGEQQKCRAVGAESHEQADRVIAETGMGKLKDMAVDVTERLEKSEAVSWSSSGRSSLKDSVNLWLEAADVLNVLESRQRLRRAQQTVQVEMVRVVCSRDLRRRCLCAWLKTTGPFQRPPGVPRRQTLSTGDGALQPAQKLEHARTIVSKRRSLESLLSLWKRQGQAEHPGVPGSGCGAGLLREGLPALLRGCEAAARGEDISNHRSYSFLT